MRAGVLRLGLDRWRAWQRQSVHRQIFGVTVTVGVLTVGAKLIAILKEAVVAHQFGTGDALEAFLMALVLPQFAINLVGGSLNAALIPTYIHVQERASGEAAHRLFASVTALSLAILIALALALGAAAPVILPVIASGFPPWKLALAESAFRWLLPTLVLSGLTTTWSAVLNAENRFALVAAAPVGTSLLTLLLVGLEGAEWGMVALVAGTVGGALIEATVVGWGLARSGVSLVPRWRGLTGDVREVVAQYLPMLAGAFLMGGTTVVSQSMAAMLDPGSVSVLAYGGKLTTLLLGVMAVAVSTAVLSPFSRLVAVGDWIALRRALRTYSRLLLAVTVPMTLVLIALSKPLVVLLFQRGAFTATDSRIVALTQAMFLLQVPLYVVGMLLVRLISALRANRWLMWGSALNLAVNVVLTYVLMQTLGVAGIALATSLMYLGSVAFLWFGASRLLRAQTAAAGVRAEIVHGDL
jgi:putative peptidoglycan lipid II flippase